MAEHIDVGAGATGLMEQHAIAASMRAELAHAKARQRWHEAERWERALSATVKHLREHCAACAETPQAPGPERGER